MAHLDEHNPNQCMSSPEDGHFIGQPFISPAEALPSQKKTTPGLFLPGASETF
jgi:hypothetical protein